MAASDGSGDDDNEKKARPEQATMKRRA
eukprot:COSAG05_NODE_11529_length_509_cov_0.717073_1_plen_27_part_10